MLLSFRTIQSVSVYVIFLFTYTNVYLFGIPYTFVVLALPVMLFFLWERISKADLKFLGIFLCIIFIGLLLSPIPGVSYLFDKTKGLVQISYSLVIGIILIRSLSDIGIEKFERIVFSLLIFVIAGSILEIIGVLKPVSEAYRAIFNLTEYQGDYRDTVITGHVRPKLFTSEPSHVSKAFLILSITWYILRQNQKRFVAVVVMNVVMFWVMASPTTILSLLAVLYLKYKRLKLVFVLLILIIFAGGYFVVTNLNMDIPQIAATIQRVENASDGRGSLTHRLIYPFMLSGDVLSSTPFFGVGVSNRTYIANLPSIQFMKLKSDKEEYVGNNAFFEIIIYFGALGFLLIIFHIYTYLKENGVDEVLDVFALLFAFNMTQAGFVTPRYWVYTFMIITAFVLINREKANG